MAGTPARLSIMLCLIATLLIAGGCAVMSQSDCLAGNWQDAGHNDALRGHPLESRLQSRQRVCSTHGVTADKVEYQKGYNEGLQEYCLPARGFYAGSHHYTYRGICPTVLEQSFLPEYIAGLRIARRETWLRYQQVDHELFDARLRLSSRSQKNVHRSTAARINRLSNRRDELRTRQFQIDRKIRLWSARLQRISA